MTPEARDRLKTTLGIRTFASDPRQMTRAEIKKCFAAKSSGRIVLRKLVRSVLWHARHAIMTGQSDPIGGSLRGLWHAWLAPVMATVDKDLKQRDDPYQVMLDEMSKLTQVHRLMSYADFELVDENRDHRHIGLSRPEIVVFSDTRGWTRLLRDIHLDHGVTTLSFPGSPSALTSEATARELLTAMALLDANRDEPATLDMPILDANGQFDVTVAPPTSRRGIHLVGIVDWSPAGHIGAEAFRTQLENFGAPVVSATQLIHPRHFTEAQIKASSRPISKRRTTYNQRWMAHSGGVDGALMSIPSEAMPAPRLEDLIKARIRALTTAAPPSTPPHSA